MKFTDTLVVTEGHLGPNSGTTEINLHLNSPTFVVGTAMGSIIMLDNVPAHHNGAHPLGGGLAHGTVQQRIPSETVLVHSKIGIQKNQCTSQTESPIA